MRKLLLLILVGLMVFVTVHRQRIFMWDPIGSVSRDGVKQGDVRVMINYSNDLLMDDKSTEKQRLYLVQNWNSMAEHPTGLLRCIEYLACMTDADRATGDKVTPGPRGARAAFEGVKMTNKRVEFVDENGAVVTVSLRP